jgi:hypothetical protein
LRYTFHDFRRLFITDAIMHGMPPHIAQLVAGHRDINTTMGYKKVDHLPPAAATCAIRAREGKNGLHRRVFHPDPDAVHVSDRQRPQLTLNSRHNRKAACAGLGADDLAGRCPAFNDWTLCGH